MRVSPIIACGLWLVSCAAPMSSFDLSGVNVYPALGLKVNFFGPG